MCAGDRWKKEEKRRFTILFLFLRYVSCLSSKELLFYVGTFYAIQRNIYFAVYTLSLQMSNLRPSVVCYCCRFCSSANFFYWISAVLCVNSVKNLEKGHKNCKKLFRNFENFFDRALNMTRSSENPLCTSANPFVSIPRRFRRLKPRLLLRLRLLLQALEWNENANAAKRLNLHIRDILKRCRSLQGRLYVQPDLSGKSTATSWRKNSN